MKKLYLISVLRFLLRHGIGVGLAFLAVILLTYIATLFYMDTSFIDNYGIVSGVSLVAGLIPFINFFIKYAGEEKEIKKIFNTFNVKTNCFMFAAWLIPYAIFAYMFNYEVLEAGYEGIGALRSAIAVIYMPYSTFFVLTKNAVLGYILTILVFGAVAYISALFGTLKKIPLKQT